MRNRPKEVDEGTEERRKDDRYGPPFYTATGFPSWLEQRRNQYDDDDDD